ncbi:uncharacterized protein LOC142884117 [Nelusetta ayraudi]|uniref:uncharacterized protein LOC142884117 n=1 Tax=Nelusetta ayraudi TaxID=303726 RepID=UPI003F709D5B
MSTSGKGRAGGRGGSDAIHVSVRSPVEIKEFTVRELKCGLAGQLGVPPESLVLIHAGQVVRESQVLSHLKRGDGTVRLCMIQRPHHSNSVASDAVQSELTVLLTRCRDDFQTPSSPTHCLGVDSSGQLNADPDHLHALQQQVGRQLHADPEVMGRGWGIHLIHGAVQTSPQVLEIPRAPDMSGKEPHHVIAVLEIPQPEQEELEAADSDVTPQAQINAAYPQVGSTSPENQRGGESKQTSPAFSHPAEPFNGATRADSVPQKNLVTGMQSLLEKITASPGLMEGLLWGPYVDTLLNCLGQNPDLAAKMLLSHPLFARDPQLQQQIRQQIPGFLQQVHSSEVLSAMLNPRATEALLQIQQALQVLAAEAPGLMPSQPGSVPEVATVTEQQQQFVQQMLHSLAETSSGVNDREELQQQSSGGSRDVAEGELTAAVQHLLHL